MYRIVCIASAVLFASACGGERSEVDTAQVCFGPSETEPAVTAEGEPLVLYVMGSAGCHTDDLAVSCSVTMDGDTLTVHTETSWVKTEPLAMSCESMLYMTSETCESPPLTAGTWIVRYGDEEKVIEVPSSIEGCL